MFFSKSLFLFVFSPLKTCNAGLWFVVTRPSCESGGRGRCGVMEPNRLAVLQLGQHQLRFQRKLQVTSLFIHTRSSQSHSSPSICIYLGANLIPSILRLLPSSVAVSLDYGDDGTQIQRLFFFSSSSHHPGSLTPQGEGGGGGRGGAPLFVSRRHRSNL